MFCHPKRVLLVNMNMLYTEWERRKFGKPVFLSFPLSGKGENNTCAVAFGPISRVVTWLQVNDSRLLSIDLLTLREHHILNLQAGELANWDHDATSQYKSSGSGQHVCFPGTSFQRIALAPSIGN